MIHTQTKTTQSLPLTRISCTLKYFAFSWSCEAVGWKDLGSKPGQLQSCHLGSTCFGSRRWRWSLHSTHGNAIHSTRRHAAVEISFVPWSHRGFKKSSVWGKLDSLRFWKLPMTSLRICTCYELTRRLMRCVLIQLYSFNNSVPVAAVLYLKTMHCV